MDQLDPADSMPILKLLQANSPELIDGEDKHIEGARAGDIVFAATGEVLPRPVEILVIAKKTLYAEWRPRTAGGGLVGHHPLSIVADARYRKGSPDNQYKEFLGDNDLIYTMYYGIKFLKDGEWTEGILVFSSTSLGTAGRPLNKLIARFKYPDETDMIPFLFSQSYMLDRTAERNDKGNFFCWSVAAGNVQSLEDDAEVLEDCLATQQAAITALPTPGEQLSLPDSGGDAAVEPDEVF